MCKCSYPKPRYVRDGSCCAQDIYTPYVLSMLFCLCYIRRYTVGAYINRMEYNYMRSVYRVGDRNKIGTELKCLLRLDRVASEY